MASKRTFGLVSDYGDSDSEDENIENEKKSSPEKFGRLVEKNTESETRGTEEKTEDETVETEAASKRSKWSGVRTEYETSSLMYRYTQDMEAEQSVTAALAEADKVVQSQAQARAKPKGNAQG